VTSRSSEMGFPWRTISAFTFTFCPPLTKCVTLSVMRLLKSEILHT